MYDAARFFSPFCPKIELPSLRVTVFFPVRYTIWLDKMHCPRINHASLSELLQICGFVVTTISAKGAGPSTSCPSLPRTDMMCTPSACVGRCAPPKDVSWLRCQLHFTSFAIPDCMCKQARTAMDACAHGPELSRQNSKCAQWQHPGYPSMLRSQPCGCWAVVRVAVSDAAC